MQFAPARDLEHVGVFGEVHAQSDVLEQFFFQPFPYLAAGDVFALAPGQRGGVDHEVHGERGFVYGDGPQSFGGVRVAQGDTDVDLVDARDQHDVARFGALRRQAVQALKSQYLTDFAFAPVLVAV